MFGFLEEFSHFAPRLAPADAAIIHDPESRCLGNDLFVCGKTYRVADFLGLDIGRALREDAPVEDHEAAE